MKTLSQNLQKHKSKNPAVRFLLNNFYEKLSLLLGSVESAKVLDAGCGEGFTVKRLGSQLKQSEIFGVDTSEEALNFAKDIAPKMNLKKGNIMQIPFQDSYFDLVLAIEVLEHLENPEKALSELKRVTKNYCIISVPNEPWFSWCNILRLKNVVRLGKNKEHINFWDKNEIVSLANEFFEVKEVVLPFPWIILLCKKKFC